MRYSMMHGNSLRSFPSKSAHWKLKGQEKRNRRCFCSQFTGIGMRQRRLIAR